MAAGIQAPAVRTRATAAAHFTTRFVLVLSIGRCCRFKRTMIVQNAGDHEKSRNDDRHDLSLFVLKYHD
jgi:hypothetical protein